MEQTQTTNQELIITRLFEAPRELVFKVCSEAEHLAQWWGPKGSTLQVKEFNFKPDGIFHYCMEMGPMVMWGKFRYIEMNEPERIVFVNSFSDEAGNVTPNAFLPDFPLEIMNILTLTEHDGRTTLTLKGSPINASEKEMTTFQGMMGGLQHGFAGTFEQLDTYLLTLQK